MTGHDNNLQPNPNGGIGQFVRRTLNYLHAWARARQALILAERANREVSALQGRIESLAQVVDTLAQTSDSNSQTQAALDQTTKKLADEYGSLKSETQQIYSHTADLQQAVKKLDETYGELSVRYPMPAIVNMPNAALREHALGLLKLFKPCDVVGKTFKRIGRPFDGGYVMLDHGLDNVVAYSLGINDDVSWDLAMAERGCDIFQYDHTIDRLPQAHPRFHWSKIGIGHERELDPQLKPIEQLIEENGHRSASDMILKMDIEGAEWKALETISSDTLAQFSQILLELHWLFHIYDPNHLRRFVGALTKLNQTHQIVHVHANNYGSVALIGGVLIPESLEVTLVRRADHQFTECRKLFPTELDMPCDPNRGDIFLGALGML